MGNVTSKRTGRRHSAATRELEKYTKPTGYVCRTHLRNLLWVLTLLSFRLYPSCPWELKIARRLIVDRKLAPRFHGKEMKEEGFTLECPICFMVREKGGDCQGGPSNDLLMLRDVTLFLVLPRESEHVELLQETHLLRALSSDSAATQNDFVRDNSLQSRDSRLMASD